MNMPQHRTDALGDFQPRAREVGVRRRRRPARFSLPWAVLCLLATVQPLVGQAEPGLVVGRVTDTRGVSVAWAEVFASRDGRRIARAVTDADGRYRMIVSPGEAQISIPEGAGILPAEGGVVTVASGGTATVDVVVERMIVNLEAIVVTGTGSVDGQSVGSVGGWVGSISQEEIRRNVSVTPTDPLRREAGVDLVDTGLGSRVVSFRGFGNIFSGAVRYLVDDRKASLPSLRANFMHFVPTAASDIERMELILGPSSAIYGPNSANGVLNVLTRSPLDLPESSVSISGGSQSVFQTEVRSSQRLGERVGLKVSGRWFEGTEYAYDDPVELRTRALIDTDPDAFRDGLRDIGVPDAEIRERETRVGLRDRGIERWSADARLDWTPSDGDTVFVHAGRTSTTGIEVTPLGAAQAGDWHYDYVQGRFRSGALFAQAFMNTSSAGETYLLRDGAPLVDDSRLVGLQLRHGLAFADGAQEITYGADWARTTPRTGGTIHGQFEADDEITEYGGYLQSRTRVASPLHLIATLRVDESNVIEDPVLSPRVGLVLEPTDGHTLSASWSRGFSTPTPTNYFLDLSAGSAPDALGMLGYRVRARGTGREGIRFSDGQGGYQGMRSPCTPQAAGGPSALVPISSAGLWQCAVGVMEASGSVDAGTAAFLRSLDPDGVGVNTFDPITSTVAPLAPGSVPDVTPLEENTATTIEVGYRGLLGERVFVQSSVWRTQRENFASPLLLRTPLLTLDGPDLTTFLESQGLPSAQAQALAAGAAQIPGGVLSSSDIQGEGAELVATYENFGTLTYWGVDLAAEAELSRNLTLLASGSWVSDDAFEVEGRTVPLNAPELRGALALAVDDLAVPLSGEVGVRYHSGFPVSSGDYVGMECMGVSGPLVEACVSDATLLDASVGYDGLLGPDLSLRVSVLNVLDTEYRGFVGVPTTGRQVLARLEYRLR